MARVSPAPARGELALAAAVLLQARKDLASARADVRSEAEAFWQDAASVQWWSDLLDLDATVLKQAVRPERWRQTSQKSF
jgi:hypothetical protein